MKIFYVIDSFDLGGAQTQLLELVQCLDKHEYQVAVCPIWPLMSLEPAFLDAGVEIIRIHKKYSIDFSEIWRLSQSMRHFQPDIVHTWLFTGNLWGRLAAIFAKVPVIVAGEMTVVPSEKVPSIFLSINRILAHWTDVITANSQSGIDRLRVDGFETSKLRRIYHGVDLKRFSPEKVNLYRDEIRNRLGIRPGVVTIFVMARMTPQKGYPVFLQAVKQIVESGSDVCCFLIGDGPDRDSLEKLTLFLGLSEIVHFLGFRQDTPELLSASDIFVISSYWEGLPNAVLEAMAMGLPVVATNVSGTAEVVQDGKTGILVPPGDSQAMANSLLFLMNDPILRDQMGTEGRKRCEKEFSLEHSVLLTTSLYNELISNKRDKNG